MREFKEIKGVINIPKSNSDPLNPDFTTRQKKGGYISVSNVAFDFERETLNLSVRFYDDKSINSAEEVQMVIPFKGSQLNKYINLIRTDVVNAALESLFPDTKGEPWQS
jgi:hypothetical protein